MGVKLQSSMALDGLRRGAARRAPPPSHRLLVLVAIFSLVVLLQSAGIAGVEPSDTKSYEK